ncbi:MAG TPA: Ig-like domain-containing protein, partial [Aestuariivirgaceae bacterium]|nr:Ig-like domain-containing protein [Aestuariivirgaceae bacterium]
MNQAPVATDDSTGTDEDAPVSGNVLANDTDADTSDVLSVSAVNGQAANVGSAVAGTYGSVVIGADGSYSFTPNSAANALAAGETATDTFTYTVSDGNGGTATASLTITITGTNDGPVANADADSTDENAAVSGNVLANDTDADTSDVLTVSEVNGAAANVGASVAGTYGSVVIGPTGAYSFTPNGTANALAAGETATDTFTYTVSDGNGGTATASLTITITGTNDGPVAMADTAGTDEDAPVSGNVLSNDTDADTSDVLSVAAVNGQAANVGASVAGTYGSVVIGADGSYSFTPNSAANALAAGETATDTFTYTVSDGNGGTATASLTITITGTNDGPVAVADTAGTDEDAAVSGNVLANDTDADSSDVLSVAAVDGQAANVGASVAGTYGSVVIGADGVYSFIPNGAANALAAGETGTDTFAYTVSDGQGGTATASLTITITGTNDGPVANADVGSTTENAAVAGNVLSNDTDADTSDVLSVSAVNGGAGNVGASVAGTYGSVVIGPTGAYSFTPNGAANALAAGETATDVFTYTVSDGQGGTASASLTITITGTNDGPVANADTGSTTENAAVAGNVLSNDTDADSSDVLSVAAVNGQAANVGASVAGTYGSVAIGADGSYSFTPNGAANALAAGEVATDTFTYTVSDGNGGTATTSLTITITGTNDGPVANADTGSTTENAAVAGNVLSNDTDADTSDLLTVSAVNGQAANIGASVAGTYGSVVIGANGAYSFTPNGAANALAAGETATDVFTYTVSDGNGGTATASLTITITGTNDGPVANADTDSTTENAAASGNVLSNDTDADTSDVLSVSAVNGAAGNVGGSVAGTYGSVVIGADGSYNFTPNSAANALAAGETATDTFAYTVSDGQGGTATASLTITITGTNDGPIANADVGSTTENAAVAGNVLANDTDADSSDVLSVAAVNGQTANVGASVAGTYGSVVIGANGAYSFTPNSAANALAAGETATDTFTYTVSDGNGGTATASLTITITGTNDGPVANADTGSTTENAAVAGNVLANDTDADTSDVLSVSAV